MTPSKPMDEQEVLCVLSDLIRDGSTSLACKLDAVGKLLSARKQIPELPEEKDDRKAELEQDLNAMRECPEAVAMLELVTMLHSDFERKRGGLPMRYESYWKNPQVRRKLVSE
jgi:hypothetical protein